MKNISLSYREVIPDHTQQEEWLEISLNTGGTTTSLQDVKVSNKAGGYCYKNISTPHNRNRFIKWQTYRDVLELTEISLDFNLYQNKLRYKFVGSPLLDVSITEQESNITVLVTTVCSLHRIKFPHPDTLADIINNESRNAAKSNSVSIISNPIPALDIQESQSLSIFRESFAVVANQRNSYHIISTDNGFPQNCAANVSASFLSSTGDTAYFALGLQTHLMFYTMSVANGHTEANYLKLNSFMPRFLSNFKESFARKGENDGDHVTSMVFCIIRNNIYLLVLCRNNILRVWSTRTCTIVATYNCENDCSRGGESHINAMQKITENRICVYQSYAGGAEFVCIDIQTQIETSADLTLITRKSISAPPYDMVDFKISDTHIWALWGGSDGEFNISYFPLSPELGNSWLSAAMEPLPDRFTHSSQPGVDPYIAYTSYLFHPGRFDHAVLAKAIYMYRRGNSHVDVTNYPLYRLKEQIVVAVETEIRNEIKDYPISENEYNDIAARQWERFYSCCEQYHHKYGHPLGLVVLKPLNGVCIIKKNTYSLLRPCEAIEHLMLLGDAIDIDVVIAKCFPNNENMGRNIVHLIGILVQIEKLLSEEDKIELDRKLYQLEKPTIFITKLTDMIVSGVPNRQNLQVDALNIIRRRLPLIDDIHLAISYLLEELRMDDKIDVTTFEEISRTTNSLEMLGMLFNSHEGLSFLSETIRQFVSTRYAICRNLLIFQQILIATCSLSTDKLEGIRSKYMLDTELYFQAYFVMVWISETPVNISAAASLDISLQRLSQLRLTNGSGRIFSNGGKSMLSPLLRVYLNSKGLYTSMNLLSINAKIDEQSWQFTLSPLINIICQHIWPISFDYSFGEWLFGTSLHTIIDDYVRLLTNWCEWNNCSRQFMLAISLLDCGESTKAYDLFLKAAKGVTKEKFLTDRILYNKSLISSLENINDATLTNSNENQSMAISMAQYFLMVIQIFEQHSKLDFIPKIAKVAIAVLEDGVGNTAQIAMFQSIIFYNCMQLKRYEDAYNSLIHNVDEERRKECLRQLIQTLFTVKRLDILIRFPYAGLRQEFEKIVEFRARSLAIKDNEVYDFLYAFYASLGKMRKASTAQYEQAMRCRLECDTLESLCKRVKSLLICLNALQLVQKPYQYIVKPNLFIDDDKTQGITYKYIEKEQILSRSKRIIIVDNDTIEDGDDYIYDDDNDDDDDVDNDDIDEDNIVDEDVDIDKVNANNDDVNDIEMNNDEINSKNQDNQNSNTTTIADYNYNNNNENTNADDNANDNDVNDDICDDDDDDDNNNKNLDHISLMDRENEKSRIIVLEINDIKCEWLQANAILELAQMDKEIKSLLDTAPSELVMILISCKLFTSALRLANGWKLSMLVIFENLTIACLNAEKENSNETWDWLLNNEVADLEMKQKPEETAWLLLKKLIFEYEDVDESVEIRRCVANKLLAAKTYLPHWLIESLKLYADWTILLRLYVQHGRYVEAAEHAIELISAMLGSGSEYFSFKNAINVSRPQLYLPVHTLDILLYGLKKCAETDRTCDDLVNKLKKKIDTYIETAEYTMNDRIDLYKRRENVEMET